MTWHDFQETKPALDCEQEAGIETEVATVEEEEGEGEGRTLVHEEEEERIPAKEEDCTTDPVPQNMEMEWDYIVDCQDYPVRYISKHPVRTMKQEYVRINCNFCIWYLIIYAISIIK